MPAKKMPDKVVWSLEDIIAISQEARETIAQLWTWAEKELPAPRALILLGRLQRQIQKVNAKAKAARRGEYDA